MSLALTKHCVATVTLPSSAQRHETSRLTIFPPFQSVAFTRLSPSLFLNIVPLSVEIRILYGFASSTKRSSSLCMSLDNLLCKALKFPRVVFQFFLVEKLSFCSKIRASISNVLAKPLSDSCTVSPISASI